MGSAWRKGPQAALELTGARSRDLRLAAAAMQVSGRDSQEGRLQPTKGLLVTRISEKCPQTAHQDGKPELNAWCYGVGLQGMPGTGKHVIYHLTDGQ